MEMAGFHTAAVRNLTALLWVGLLVTDSMLILTGRCGHFLPDMKRAESQQMLQDWVTCSRQ